MELRTRDRKFLVRVEPAEDLEVVRAAGSFLFDRRGKKYIDFTSGWCTGNLGWGMPDIRRALARRRALDYAPPSYLYRPWVELAELLVGLTHGKLAKCFRTTDGTETVEAALQAAMVATGRRKLVSLEGSYHGNSFGAKSIGASENGTVYPNLLAGCGKLKPPLDADALGRLEKLLKGRDVAAFIMEPVVCNLGVVIPEAGFMRGLQGLCRKYGTLLVLDEVATGFGRTGTLFAFERYGLEPDALCLAKAITGGYAGLGAALVTEKLARAVQGRLEFYSTFGWHPVAVDAALANLRYWKRHAAELLKGVERRSLFFRERLSAMPYNEYPDIRIAGLAMGLEFGRAETAEDLADRCREAGLLATTQGATLMLLPALNIPEKTAARAMDILESCL